MNEPWSKTIKKRSSYYLRDYESDIHETGMVGSWYVLVMCEKEPLQWTRLLPSNGRKTSKCGGILTKKQSAALTLEARIMNFLVRNPQVIPHRTGPSRQVLLGSRLPMSAYRLVCLSILSIAPWVRSDPDKILVGGLYHDLVVFS